MSRVDGPHAWCHIEATAPTAVAQAPKCAGVVVGPGDQLVDDFRDVMAEVCAPVVIATSMSSGRPHGTTVSSFTSLSLSPPLVSIALHQDSQLLDMLRSIGRLGINLLGWHQAELARDFARRRGDRFSEVPWVEDHGLPLIDGSIGWVVCDALRLVRGGDHVIVVGRVAHASYTQAPPLVYHARMFGTHSRFAELDQSSRTAP